MAGVSGDRGGIAVDFYGLEYWEGWEEGKFPPYWEELRRFVFRRDKYRCQSCGLHFWGPDLDAHHVIPWQHGGTDSAANLITVCEPCHDELHDALIAQDKEPDILPDHDAEEIFVDAREKHWEYAGFCCGIVPIFCEADPEAEGAMTYQERLAVVPKSPDCPEATGKPPIWMKRWRVNT
jgi:hypothetical protein